LADEPLNPGLHESLLTTRLEELIANLSGDALVPQIGELADAEASDRMSRHMAALIAQAIEAAPERERRAAAVRIATELIRNLQALTGNEFQHDQPIDPGQVLLAILRRLPDGNAEFIERPLTPLLDTTIFTGRA
jgi:hypothetical protein